MATDLLNIAKILSNISALKPISVQLPGIIIFSLLIITSCRPIPVISKAPPGKPFVYENKIELVGGNFSKGDKETVLQRLSNQLDDSSRVAYKDLFFVLRVVKSPVAYDTGYSAVSASNMISSMHHLGYYNAGATFRADTTGRKVRVTYTVNAGKPTLIDTVNYRFSKPDLQRIATESKNDALLVKNNPVTKTAVLGEIARLVDSFRNNGYYKITAAELRVRGDTSIAALTTISEDPFEQLRLLEEARQKKDSPEIKLALVLIRPEDSTRLNPYFINKIYVLSDFQPGDLLSDTVNLSTYTSENGKYFLRYHRNEFKPALFARNITMRNGDLFRQEEYNKTLLNLTRLGVWQSVNIRILENLDEPGKVDLVIELLPGRKFGFETSAEASYSSVSNTNFALGGNLFGISGNISLTNKNLGKEAIRMTQALRAGIELNNKTRNNSSRLINSNEFSYSNNVLFPRLTQPFKYFLDKKPFLTKESFLNLNLAVNNRLDLFGLQSAGFNYGFTVMTRKKDRFSFRFPNAEFSYLFNQTDSFRNILDSNKFLKYSYNTAFILGTSATYVNSRTNPFHPHSLSRERGLKFNAEESGLTIGALPILNRYKKKYIKLDGEYKYTITYPNNKAVALRLFAGVGIALFGDSMPFFKQYFGGGSNSMRGWPVRGIGRGGERLTPYRTNLFNDRTGDMQIEINSEYRYDIARIVPNLITLRGALFIDAGNIWNLKNLNPTGGADSAQFKLSNLYKQLGISAGTGLRVDFNYLTLRFDFGFRFKRPETSFKNAGWKAPPISFGDLFPKLFSAKYRQWRYENFNFTIGINYPF